jgi:hypothetical protein
VHDYAFANCAYLESVVVPDSVAVLGEGAFSDCENLRRIELADGLQKIEDLCFRNCPLLEEIKIPDSVTEIGWGLFSACSDDLLVITSDNLVVAKYCDLKGIRHAAS